jgi:hypothetical protein
MGRPRANSIKASLKLRAKVSDLLAMMLRSSK